MSGFEIDGFRARSIYFREYTFSGVLSMGRARLCVGFLIRSDCFRVRRFRLILFVCRHELGRILLRFHARAGAGAEGALPRVYLSGDS